ncbi:hypothetical protein WJX84_004444 [Apatococcus fuscideae]|uniref:Uncharacterized protein n=1 Tax=Apatococcus fuscideae TaxID=2026836 RepID=A0AAW1TD20_9CHLO
MMAPAQPLLPQNKIVTPSKAPWNLGTPQRTAAFDQKATRSEAAGLGSARRVVATGGDKAQGTPARTANRKLLPPTPGTNPRLVAASLSSLPNAHDAQFWISRANGQLALGNLQAALDFLREGQQRGAGPATAISRAIAQLTGMASEMVHTAEQPGAPPGAVGTLQSSSEVGSQPGSATFLFAQTEHRPAPGLLPSSPGTHLRKQMSHLALTSPQRVPRPLFSIFEAHAAQEAPQPPAAVSATGPRTASPSHVSQPRADMPPLTGPRWDSMPNPKTDSRAPVAAASASIAPKSMAGGSVEIACRAQLAFDTDCTEGPVPMMATPGLAVGTSPWLGGRLNFDAAMTPAEGLMAAATATRSNMQAMSPEMGAAPLTPGGDETDGEGMQLVESGDEGDTGTLTPGKLVAFHAEKTMAAAIRETRELALEGQQLWRIQQIPWLMPSAHP